MKKIDVNLILIGVLVLTVIGLLVRGPKIKEVEKIVEVQTIINDTIEVEKLKVVEVQIEVPYEVTIIKEIEKVSIIYDTIIEQKFVKVPVEIFKEVEKIVEVPRPKTNDWYLGMGYDFGTNPFFSGVGTRVLYKTKNNIMFGSELGFRNNITNFETMEGIMKPYIGGVVYIKLNK